MTSIGDINLSGLFKNINQQFSFHDAFKELIDNSLDANARHINIRFDSNVFVFMDDGDGLTEENICNKMMKLFLTTENNEGKRGSKGIGLKAALIKITNFKNIEMLTKTKDSEIFKVCFPIQTVIQKNDIRLIKYEKAVGADLDRWYKYAEECGIFHSGTIIYSENISICSNILDQIHAEELINELTMVYSNFMQRTEIKLKFNGETDIICKPHPLFCLIGTNHFRCIRVRLNSIKKEFIFSHNGKWYQIYPSSKKDKIKEFTGDFSCFVLKCNIYWWYEKDNEKYLQMCNVENQPNINDVASIISGFYSCRELKFSECGFKLPDKFYGDFSLQRDLYSKSVWIIEFNSKLDEIMGTLANKSRLSKTHMDAYVYACIIELAKWYIGKIIEEYSIESKNNEVLILAKTMAAEMVKPLVDMKTEVDKIEASHEIKEEQVIASEIEFDDTDISVKNIKEENKEEDEEENNEDIEEIESEDEEEEEDDEDEWNDTYFYVLKKCKLLLKANLSKQQKEKLNKLKKWFEKI